MGKREKRKKSTFKEYLESIIIAVLLAFVIKTSIVEAYKIPTGSMEDTLLVGDFLLANKFIYGARLPLIGVRLPALQNPHTGQVVIFKYPLDRKTNYIKRVVATEGQVVEIKDKRVYVDGKLVPEPPHSKHTDPRDIPRGVNNRDNFGPVRVPKGYIFVMGDNRDNSFDSRFWGFLDKKLIRGKGMIIHFSWEPDPSAPRLSWDNPLSVIHLFFYNLIHFPQRIRWKRLGDLIK